MAVNGELTPEQADRNRLAALATQSVLQDVAFVEIVYKGRWVRFDISTIQASFLSLDQLVDRCFREPFQVLQMPLAPTMGQLSSSTLVPKE